LNSKIFKNLNFSDDNSKSERNPDDNKILLKNLPLETVYINKNNKFENQEKYEITYINDAENIKINEDDVRKDRIETEANLIKK